MNATAQAIPSNFAFLAKRYPQLERIGALSERYFSDDPIISLITRCRGKLMIRKFAWDPEHWRFRAEEACTVADQMTHEEARTIMRRIAND